MSESAEALTRIVDERECERLILEYTHLVDFGRAPEIADLFTTDGVWRSDDLVMDSQDEIRAGFQRRQGVTRRQSRHVCTNIVVNIEGDQATALSYLVNYRYDSPTGQAEVPSPSGAPKYVGEYRDAFVRTELGWRFKDRYFQLAFVRPAAITST